MTEPDLRNPTAHFDKQMAAAYDTRFAKVAAMKDSLHLLMRILFSDLPARARVLCVGVGTGAEVIALAKAFPHYEFTAVEPSPPMLEVCRQRCEDEGIATRCTFHEGYIHNLPPAEPFDAATSLLVSQFLVQRPDRVAFFQAIAARLNPQGCLINADLSSDLDSEETADLKEFWRKMLLYSDTPEENTRTFVKAWQKDVAVVPPGEVAEIITEGGFAKPTLFYQNLFIHAWHARVAE